MISDFCEKSEGSKAAVTPVCKKYEKDYHDEKKLNEDFNRFVANYRMVYEGPNTASAQIGAKYSTGL